MNLPRFSYLEKLFCCFVGVFFVFLVFGHKPRLFQNDAVEVFNSKDIVKWISMPTEAALEKRFVRPGIESSYHAFFFNVTNPHAFSRGAKPRLREVGPYVYRQSRKRIDVQRFSNNTVNSKTMTTYYFDARRSGGQESDVLTIINIPFLSALYKYEKAPLLANSSAKEILERSKEGLFSRRNVSELLWGYSEHISTEDSNLQPQFGFMVKKNNTAGPVMSQHVASLTNFSMHMDVDKVNNSAFMRVWTTNTTCDRYEGSDGSGFPPIKRNLPIKLLVPDMCRAMSLSPFERTNVHHAHVTRYSPTASIFSINSTLHPENACFGQTDFDTLFDASKCVGAPVLISWPHFFEADPRYLKQLEGLAPNADKHQFFFDISKLTGIPLEFETKIQINIKMVNSSLDIAKGSRDMVFPAMWSMQVLDGVPLDIMNHLLEAQFLYLAMYNLDEFYDGKWYKWNPENNFVYSSKPFE